MQPGRRNTDLRVPRLKSTLNDAENAIDYLLRGRGRKVRKWKGSPREVAILDTTDFPSELVDRFSILRFFKRLIHIVL